MPVGIDDMAIYVPKLYIDYKDFVRGKRNKSTKTRIWYWYQKDGFGRR